jgi:hypothetical protein
MDDALGGLKGFRVRICIEGEKEMARSVESDVSSEDFQAQLPSCLTGDFIAVTGGAGPNLM